jgi:hypothetical protein
VSDALQIKGHTSVAPKPYVTGKQLDKSGDHNVIDPSLCLEAEDAKKSAADNQEYGGPTHLQERIKVYEQRKRDAFAEKWNQTALAYAAAPAPKRKK